MSVTADNTAIRPFTIDIPEAEVEDLRAHRGDAFAREGYGFSGKPTTTGWSPDRVASASLELMKASATRALSPKAATGARSSWI
jgi:hypothetical protein